MTWLAILRKIPLSLYVIVALLIALVACYVDIERLHATMAKEESTLQNAVNANNTNLLTIKALQTANDAWRQRCQEDAVASQNKLAELQKEINRAADDEAGMKRQLDAVYETDAKAKSWGDAVVPDDVVQRLRKSADHR